MEKQECFADKSDDTFLCAHNSEFIKQHEALDMCWECFKYHVVL